MRYTYNVAVRIGTCSSITVTPQFGPANMLAVIIRVCPTTFCAVTTTSVVLYSYGLAIRHPVWRIEFDIVACKPHFDLPIGNGDFSGDVTV